MKIKKFQKKNNYLYKVYLEDNEVLELCEDIILKYDLLLSKEIIVSMKDCLLKENNLSLGYYKALRYINLKMRSLGEMKRYLKDYSVDDQNIIISRLKKEGYLDESKYIAAYIQDKINFTNWGYLKILNNLKNMGYREDMIKSHLDLVDSKVWFERCENYVSKKKKANAKYSSNKLKKKIEVELTSLGYSYDDIKKVLEDIDSSNDINLLKKDYEKAYKILSRKYKDKELLYKIKSNLYNKGYKIEDINKILDN